jgi:hypothetical protein
MRIFLQQEGRKRSKDFLCVQIILARTSRFLIMPASLDKVLIRQGFECKRGHFWDNLKAF